MSERKFNCYLLYIKYHDENSDWEQTVQASNRKEAVDMFYGILRGEFDKEWINNEMVREYKEGYMR